MSGKQNKGKTIIGLMFTASMLIGIAKNFKKISNAVKSISDEFTERRK
jgi:hypothetical protein